ncbi:prefoldin subunit 5 [[Candida] anglica]|uniref:Prefoldin subunit 5 n=1 Tax=[Candida] anglica TaxID=148631 RepID=A0ABP0E522_9ASCO
MSAQPRKIDLSQLQPQQIVELRKSTEQEIQHFTQSLQALQTAQSKLKDCITSIDGMASSEASELLVPLTSSLYLPGRVGNKDRYLVDIGTGYFVEKSAKEAKLVYEGKINKLNDDSKKLKDILVQKNEILNSMSLVLRQKMIQYEQQQQEQQAAA